VADEPIDAVTEIVADAGIGGRPLRQLILRLTESPAALEDLIRDFAVPRRTVEALLRAAGPDLDDGVLPQRYRDRFTLRPRPPADTAPPAAGPQTPDHARNHASAALIAGVPAGDRATEHASAAPISGTPAACRPLDQVMAALIAGAPAADRALDHVSATAETAARRAAWLGATFDLAGAHLLCVGDHDLTSLAVDRAGLGCRVSVVDVDERLLEYIAAQAPGVDCYYGDLRFGLPPALAGTADLIFTDPPYTPEGVQLFLGRGAQALRDRTNGRLVMAYGFSPLTPALGLKVQKAMLELDLVLEAILPTFNRYHGAQAIGSAADLYVCRPTTHTWPILDQRLGRIATNIYTHGGQSLEAATAPPSPSPTASAGLPAAVSPGPPGALRPHEVLAGGPRPRETATVDLSGDPGPWLLRALLALNCASVTLLVPNHHPDLADAAGQAALRELVAAKWDLRFRRSTPGPKQAIVEATASMSIRLPVNVPPTTKPPHDSVTDSQPASGTGSLGQTPPARRPGAGGPGPSQQAHWLLTHAHGKVGNALRTLGRADLLERPTWVDARLIDLPRAAIVRLLRAL